MSLACRQMAAPAGQFDESSAAPLRVEERAAADVPAEAWYGLEAAAAEPNVFCGRDFALSYGTSFGLDARLRAVTVTTGDGRLDAAVLFHRHRRWGRPVAVNEGFHTPFSGSSVPLVRRGREAAVAAALLGAMRARVLPNGPWLFPVVPIEGPVTDALLEEATANGIHASWFARHRRPVVEPGKAEKAEFFVSGGSRLKKYRQLGRKLHEEGEVTFETAREPGLVAQRLETFLEIEAAGWKGKLGTAAAQHPEQAAMFRTFAAALARRGWCRIDTLFLGGRPIAIGITPQHDGAAWFWKVAYDEAYGKFSPYIQLLMEQTREIVETGEPPYVDSCAAGEIGPCERVWHQTREFGDLMLVPRGGLVSPALAGLLERSRRSAREQAVRVRDAVRARIRRSPAP